MQSRPPAVSFGPRSSRGFANAIVVGGDSEWRIATARELHRSGPGTRLAFISFDALRAPDALMQALSAWAYDPDGKGPERSLQSGTLYVEHVTELGVAAQAALLSFAQRISDRRATDDAPARLIAGSADDPWLAAEEGTFSAALCDCLDKLRIDAPVRRRRSVA